MGGVVKKRSKKVGLEPGTVVHIGEQKDAEVKISIINYDEQNFEEKATKRVEDCFPFKDKQTITWINVDGIHQPEIIEKIGKHFDFHPLLLEDIVNTNQRPKIENYENYLFIVLKMLYHDEKEGELKNEQVSLILGETFVISFQESEGDVFNTIRDRLRTGRGRTRKMGASYLAYSIIDAIVDNYFVVLESVGEKITEIEEIIIENPSSKTLNALYRLKREIIFLRKLVWPLREVINSMVRGEYRLIKKSTIIYLRDVYDHTIQIIDTIETSRDLISGLFDIYLTTISNRMNEIMKVLTVFATIFIPLTFVASVYGMNFRFMPELGLVWGYPVVIVSMVVVSLIMIAYFRNKNWL